MFGLPVWLAQIIVTMICNLGLPLAEKALPHIPSAVWTAIQDILRHLNGQSNQQVSLQKGEQFRQAVDSIVTQKP